MAKTVTLANLRTYCRDRYEIPSDQVSDSTLTTWINSAYFKLYNTLLRHSPDWYVSSEAQNLTDGTRAYNLPSGCYRVRRVDILLSSGDYATLFPYNFHEENAIETSFIPDRATYRYHVSGSTIRLAPVPTETITNGLVIFYNPAPTSLSADGDTIDGVAGWEEFIVLDVGIKAYHKLDWDAVPLVAERREMEALIKSLASGQDVGNPKRIRDVYAEIRSAHESPWKGVG